MRNAGEKDGSYLVTTYDYDYSLNVCGPVAGGCGNGTTAADAGGCQTERHGNKQSFSMGKASKHLRRLAGDVIELKYDSGESRLRSAFVRDLLL